MRKQTGAKLVHDHNSMVTHSVAMSEQKVSGGNLGEARENVLPQPAKVGVVGSNPIARSNSEMSGPETWVTERT
jgi:hypothetical protein